MRPLSHILAGFHHVCLFGHLLRLLTSFASSDTMSSSESDDEAPTQIEPNEDVDVTFESLVSTLLDGTLLMIQSEMIHS